MIFFMIDTTFHVRVEKPMPDFDNLNNKLPKASGNRKQGSQTLQT